MTTIRLADLRDMFDDMRARAPRNVDGPQLWGYFFFDPDPAKLRIAAAELQTQGYCLVAVEQVEDDALFRLHVERVELHTPDSLDARNQEFYALAARLGIETYDGMDVGPPTPLGSSKVD